MFGVVQSVGLAICETPKEAEERGYVYLDGFTLVEIQKAVIVREGTENGKSTVDFILVDQAGNKYVARITADILKTICKGAR